MGLLLGSFRDYHRDPFPLEYVWILSVYVCNTSAATVGSRPCVPELVVASSADVLCIPVRCLLGLAFHVVEL